MNYIEVSFSYISLHLRTQDPLTQGFHLKFNIDSLFLSLSLTLSLYEESRET